MSQPTFPQFSKPPINEVGFSIQTDGMVADPYDIRSIHDLFRKDYPRHERQPPVGALEAAQMLGIPAAISEDDNGAPPRWWFLAQSGKELVQVQERFIGWNWRRQEPTTQFVPYPGYNELSQRAFAVLETLWRQGQASGSSLAPIGAQLLYDNLIPLRSPGRLDLKLDDVLRNWASSGDRKINFGWNLRWFEEVGGTAQSGDLPQLGAKPLLSTNISVVGVIESGEVRPVLRIQFLVTGRIGHWDAAKTFFDEGHAYIREAFLKITTDDIRATWGEI